MISDAVVGDALLQALLGSGPGGAGAGAEGEAAHHHQQQQQQVGVVVDGFPRTAVQVGRRGGCLPVGRGWRCAFWASHVIGRGCHRISRTPPFTRHLPTHPRLCVPNSNPHPNPPNPSPQKVDFLKLLHDKLAALHRMHADGPLSAAFPRPNFKVVVLYVDEETSTHRQLARAAQTQARNRRALDAGAGGVQAARATDVSADKARKRYHVFKHHYSAILRLKQFFPVGGWGGSGLAVALLVDWGGVEEVDGGERGVWSGLQQRNKQRPGLPCAKTKPRPNPDVSPVCRHPHLNRHLDSST